MVSRTSLLVTQILLISDTVPGILDVGDVKMSKKSKVPALPEPTLQQQLEGAKSK